MNDADQYTRLRQQLVTAVRSICPAWLRSRDDDLVQAGIMAVMRIRQKKETDHELPTSYLRRVAYTALIDEIRRHRSRREVPLENTMGDELVVPGERPSPEREALGREISAGIRACLKELVEPRQMAVTLHLLGYGVPQIAKKMGWKTKRASNLVYRGLEGLRDCLRRMELAP